MILPSAKNSRVESPSGRAGPPPEVLDSGGGAEKGGYEHGYYARY